MDGDPYTRLTKAQLEALRLIPELRDHKLVAHRLGITLDALRERLRDARATLGVGRSWDAAIVVQKREADYTRDVDTSWQLPGDGTRDLTEWSTRDETSAASALEVLREEASPFGRRVGPETAQGRRRWRDLFLRRTGGRDNALTIVETLLAIGITLMAIAAAAFFIAMAMEAYSRHRLEVGAQPPPSHSE